MGGEQTIAKHWKLGFALGQLQSNDNVGANAGRSTINAMLTSIYGTYIIPSAAMDLFATAGLTGGYDAIESNRTVSNSGVAATAKSDSDAIDSGVFFKAGLRDPLPDDWSLLPQLRTSYTHSSASGYNEQGGGLAGISLDSTNFGVWKTSEDITLLHERGMDIGDGIMVKPRLTFGLSQEYSVSGHTAHGNFSDGTPLALALDRSENNFVDTGAGMDFAFSDSVTGFIDY